MSRRLVSVGNVVVDLVTNVPALPERGTDVLATASSIAAGGAFNAMVAAVRQGLPTAYAGGHGTGYFGDLVRSSLAAAAIETLVPIDGARDSGYDLALVDDGGERTFVTVFGAEAELTTSAVESIETRPGDLVLVSGYGLLPSTNGGVLGPWLDALDASHTVLLDPGPLVAEISPEVWALANARADWMSCNEREAVLLTGKGSVATAADILAGSGNVLVRLGAGGCLLGVDGVIEHIRGFEVDAIDTNGAGDAHAGAFLAALAAGVMPREAARRANACAALAVTRRGPATAPTLAEVLALLASTPLVE
ncbi:MAG TPA: PfkB family carbohydrate kinase [Galbitalea sp.]